MALSGEFESCKMDLQGQIVAPGGANVTELFSRLDACIVNTKCKIQRWIMQLEQKTKELEQQLKIEQEGYSGFDLPGFGNCYNILLTHKKRNFSNKYFLNIYPALMDFFVEKNFYIQTIFALICNVSKYAKIL